MKHYLWSTVLISLDQIEARAQEARADLARRQMQLAGVGRSRAPATLTDVQRDIVELLRDLKTRLRHNLTEEEIYRILFALVIMLDERMRSRVFREFDVIWPPMQEELLDIDDGGDLFFDAVDEMLARPDVAPFVLEIFFFCLKAGFQGRFESQPAMIARYVDRISARMPAPPEGGGEVDSPRVKWVETPPAWIYGTALASVAALYLIAWWVGGG